MAASRLKICALLAILVASANGAGAAEDITLLRAREGAAALLRGQFDKAVQAYNLALETPDIADFTKANIYSDRGLAKWRLKQTKEALADFNQSIKLSPENPTAYNNRGNALMDLGHPEEAVKDFDRAITLSPNYGAAYNNRGNAYSALGQYDKAFQDFRKAVELMPTSPAPFNGRGKAHAALNRYHAAIRDYSRALSLNTRYEAAYENRGEANLALDQFGEAQEDLSQALEIRPDQPELLLLRAQAQIGAKQTKDAQKDLDKAIELNPDFAEAYLERGILFSELGRFDEAVEDFNRAIVIDSDNVKAYAMRAAAKQQIEAQAPKPPPETVVAKPQGETVVVKDSDDGQTNQAAEGEVSDEIAVDEAAVDGGAAADAVAGFAIVPPPVPYAEALRDAEQALSINPDDALALRIRGDIYLARGNTDRAVADYRLALAQDPYQSESREALVKLEQEVPPEEGAPLTEPVSGWVITERFPGRYVATNPKYRSVIAELEMFGAGQPRILDWKLLKSNFSGIGLLRYHAGDQGDGSNLEYVAIVDLSAKKVVSIEPHSWGGTEAQWTWQQASVVVTDPEGNANEVKLRKTRVARPAARDDGGFFGFGGQSRQETRRSRRGGGGGGGGGGMLDWLFR